MKRIVNIKESHLRQIVSDSVKKVLAEDSNREPSEYFRKGIEREYRKKEANLKKIEFMKRNFANENSKFSLFVEDWNICLRQALSDRKYIQARPFLNDTVRYEVYELKPYGIGGVDFGDGGYWTHEFVLKDELRKEYPEDCEIVDKCEEFIRNGI